MAEEARAAARDGDASAGDVRSERAKLAEARYRVAAGAALVAGAFSVFVVALMLSSHVRARGGDLIDPPAAMAEAKKTLVKPSTTGDEKALKAELTERIRRLDVELRRSHLSRMAFRSMAGYLLLAGVAVLVTALQFAAAFREKLPHPEGEPTPGDEARSSRLSRWAVGALGLVLLAGAVGLVAACSDRAPRRPAAGPPPGEPVAEPAGKPGDAPAAARSYPSAEEMARNWPRFRGPGGSGVSPLEDIPDTWDGERGENILWKTPVPLEGASSPIVWGKRVFLTGAGKKQRAVYCVDAGSGKVLWTHDCAGVAGSPVEVPKVYNPQGYAASTPATDGRRVYAVFATGDILAVDFEGKRVWARSLGLPRSEWGFTASLATWRDRVILQSDQSDEDDEYSSILAIDAATGKTVWKTERDVPGSWASPIVVDTGKGDRIITAADPWVIAYEPEKGKELWRAELLGGYVAPSPIYAGGMVFVVMSDTGLSAVRPGGSGDVTATHVEWGDDEAELPDTSTPVSDGKLLFMVSSDGYLTCFDAKDGVALWEKELDYETYVSPSIVGKRLIVVGDEGTVNVLEAARKLKTVAENKLDGEPFLTASPAFAAVGGKGRMFLRTDKHLYCIGKR